MSMTLLIAPFHSPLCNPHHPTPPIQGCGTDVSVQAFPFAFQRDLLIWGFLPGTPLLACCCIFWNVGPSALGCWTPAAEYGSRLASPPDGRRSTGWGSCARGPAEAQNCLTSRGSEQGLGVGGGWSAPHPPEETVGDYFSSGVRPGPKFPLAPSQQQDLSRPLPPNSPGFSAALPAPSVAVTVRRYHEGKQHGTLSGTEHGFARSELLLCYCVASLPSRTKPTRPASVPSSVSGITAI